MKAKLMFIAVLALLLTAGPAQAIRIQLGDLVVNGDGGFKPKTLPKFKNAPISVHGGGSVSTVSGDYPPVIKEITLEYDRHGAVQTRGLPKCRRGQLEASTVPAARKRCPGSIVGRGHGRGVVVFPESRPIPVESPITIFNGPRVRGNPTVFAHFYTTVPVPTAFVVPIVIEKIRRGEYGYRTVARIPAIAGGNGIPLAGWLKVGRKWRFKGKRHSYINARCETGHLQARGLFKFKGDNGPVVLRGNFIKRCKVRR
jgi:hypothetical protein